MGRVLRTALATATLVFAAPAIATVTLTTSTGQLSTHINSSTVAGTPQDALTVWGSTLSGGGSHDVDFTGNTTLHISPGAGFAAISDPNNNGDIYSLIIDPAAAFNFSQIDFSVQTYQDTFILVEYTLASGGGWLTPGGLGDPFAQSSSQLNDYLLTATGGDVLGAIRISTCLTATNCADHGAGIFLEKQNSITLAPAVPEPATWAMMLFGFGAMGASLRRSRRRSGKMLQIA